MNSSKIMLCILTIFISLIIVGCDASVNEESTYENPEVTEYDSPLIIDNYGREVEIAKKPTDVLTFGPNTTELFIALGLSEYVIGNSLNNHSRGALPEYADIYEHIPELTYGSATREAVLTSGADFVYGIDWEFGEAGINIEELKDHGITTYVNSASSLEEMYQEIIDIGKIFDVEYKAEAFVADKMDRIADIQERISQQEPVKVLVYDGGGEGVFTAGGKNFESLLIELAGGENVFNDIEDKQWATVSYEEVLAREPDVILIHDYDTPSIEEKLADIKSHPALSQLDSVKNENFVTISLESVLPGGRMAYTIESLAEGFYPELFGE